MLYKLHWGGDPLAYVFRNVKKYMLSLYRIKNIYIYALNFMYLKHSWLENDSNLSPRNPEKLDATRRVVPLPNKPVPSPKFCDWNSWARAGACKWALTSHQRLWICREHVTNAPILIVTSWLVVFHFSVHVEEPNFSNRYHGILLFLRMQAVKNAHQHHQLITQWWKVHVYCRYAEQVVDCGPGLLDPHCCFLHCLTWTLEQIC